MLSSDHDDTTNNAQKFINSPLSIELFTVQTYGNISSALILLGLASQTKALPPLESSVEPYDISEDFKWFTSGELDTSSFKGRYIAIWKKQVVASGNDALEVENIAKAYYGEGCRPAIVYISEDDNSIL
jgi:hypothetical protein